jgi:hypothetical protein
MPPHHPSVGLREPRDSTERGKRRVQMVDSMCISIQEVDLPVPLSRHESRGHLVRGFARFARDPRLRFRRHFVAHSSLDVCDGAAKRRWTNSRGCELQRATPGTKSSDSSCRDSGSGVFPVPLSRHDPLRLSIRGCGSVGRDPPRFLRRHFVAHGAGALRFAIYVVTGHRILAARQR